MTVSHVAARAGAPSDSTVVLVRHPSAKRGSDGDADADFGRHVDGLADVQGVPVKAALATVGDHGSPTSRWQPPIDARSQIRLLDEAATGEQEAVEAGGSTDLEVPSDAVLPSSLPTSDPLLLTSDVAAAAASLEMGGAGPAELREPAPVGADDTPRPGTSSRLLATMLSEAPDNAKAPTEPSDLPRLELIVEAREAPRRGSDVLVVARETHLLPAALPPAMRAKPSGERDTAHSRADSAAGALEARLGKGAVARTVARATSAVAVEPAAQPKRGNKDAGEGAANSGQLPASSMPGKLPPTDATQRAQAQTADETSFDPAQPARLVRTSAQDEHPAPAQAAVPVTRQIVDGIAAEIAPPHDTGRVGAAPAAAPTFLPQPVKVVTIQLSPAELGTLTVRISLRNDALELQVETGRRETARMVDADRDTLSNLLRAAGYQVETMTVRAVEQPVPAMVTGTPTGSPDGAPQSQPGGSQADQRSAGGRAHADGHREGHGTRQDTRGDEGLGPHAGRGLYV
jgi:chemotaxis protein MotD